VAVTAPDDHSRYMHYDLQRRLAAEFERESSGSYAYRQYRYNDNSDVTVSQDYRLVSAPADPFPYDHYSASDSQIRGHIDGVFRHSDGRDYITGWACASAFNESIRVHVYLGGPAGSGDGVASVLSSSPSESAVANACTAFGSNYRFKIPISESMLANHAGDPIYIHGISPYGPPNSLITQSGTYHIPGGTPPGGPGGGDDPPPCPTQYCEVPVTYPEGPGSMAVPVAGTTGNLHRQNFIDYDELGRVRAKRGNDGQHLAYAYTLNGKVKTITDVGANPDRVTTYLYDPLDRVKQIIDAKNGNTYFKYDASDRIVEVKDPRGRITTYKYDGFGQLWTQISPDTGTTSFAYNAGGQLTSMTRHDGSTLTYDYDDPLGRLRSITGAGELRSYTYDACANGKGQMCSVVSALNGANVTKVDLTYTQQGQLATRADKAGGFTDTTNYQYDGMGRLTKLTYPSAVNTTYGVAANYAYSHGKLTSLTATIGTGTLNIATGIQYQPFGGATGWTYGNGMTRGQGYDLDGRLQAISSNNGPTVMQSLTYAWNANDLIEAVTNVDGANSHDYEYDEVGRLTKDFIGGSTTGTLDQFDAVGNRISRGSTAPGSAPTSQYTIEPTSNQMLNQTGNANRNFVYTPNGHLQSSTGWLGNRSYVYDAFDRLKSTTVDGVATSYLVNALDQRMGKTGPLGTFRYVYAGQNMLLAEHDGEGATGWKNFLYLNGEPVALVSGNGVRYFLHNDHLGRPELITDINKTLKWKAANGSYSRTVTLGDPNMMKLGFPGQYWDEETDTWHNGFRDYDPYTGRYIQSDPIGLAGGLNTYAYVDGNPVMRADPSGLDVCLESTNNPTVPFGLHQRVAVYDSSGGLVHGQSFGTNNPNTGLSTSEKGSSGSGGADQNTGEVYNNTNDTTRDKKECTASSDKQNAKIVLPMLQSELGQQGPYSATGIGGTSCRSYSNDAYNRIKQALRSAGGG
jgi:RHS repeat-associated protein